MTIKILSQLLMEIIPEANNAYEAIDIYSTRLYKRIKLKDEANIDARDDIDLYLYLNAYRTEIAERTYQQYIKGEIK